MSKKLWILPIVFVIGAIGVTVAVAASTKPGEGDALAGVRAATAKYHDIQAALDDGYLMPPDCVSSPAGGMGFHLIKPALFANPALDESQPEALLYVPSGNKLRLVAVEWLYAYGPNDPGPNAVVPSLFGTRFDGPMPGHFPGMPWHSELHAWVWQANPTGVFMPWNPKVSC